MRTLKVFLLLLIPITIIAQDTNPDDIFNIILSQDFEHHNAPVLYDRDLFLSDNWNADRWNGYDHYRAGDFRYPQWYADNVVDSIVIDPISGSKVLRLMYAEGIHDGYDGQSGRGGEWWRTPLPGAPYTEVYVSMNVMLRPGWEWSAGGKIVGGVYGGTYSDSPEPAQYGEGFRANVIWDFEGDDAGNIAFYVYSQDQTHTHGQLHPFEQFQPEGEGLTGNYNAAGKYIYPVTNYTWVNITTRWVVNTHNGSTPNHDGLYEGYINGHLVGQVGGRYMITYPDIGNEIHTFLMYQSFGGGGPPLRNEWSFNDDIVVFTYDESVDVPRGNELSEPGRVLSLPNWPKVTTVDIVIPTMPLLPDVSIIDVTNTPVPNISIAEAKISSFGQAEIYDYGLTITKSEEPIADELLILASQDNSDIWNSERASRGLKALYFFNEGEGNQIQDNSDADSPVNLEIQDPSEIDWLPGRGLKVNGSTIISSTDVPTDLINSITSTNQITIEAWIKPEDINQYGPARIISLSKSTVARAVTLGHEGNHANYRYIARLNTTSTNENGDPTVYTVNNFNSLNLHHVVYTRTSNGEEKIYVNGQECYTGLRGGDFSSMGDDYYLSIANELSGDRPWIGTFYLVAIYNQALNQAEIDQNYAAGLGEIRFTTNLLVEPNVTYLVTPFARTNQGVIYGSTDVLRPWSNTSNSPFEDQVGPYHSIDR